MMAMTAAAAGHMSDYDTDYHALAEAVSNPPPARSNEELNLKVIQRYRPDITAIISIAMYAVVYTFSPESQSWEKSGVEGTLFICALLPSPAGAERYAVLVLNRRGLDNFVAELRSPTDVEITEEYIILQLDDEETVRNTGAPKIVGLWIYSEPPPSSTAEARQVNAEIIRECATRAERTREAVAQPEYGYQ
jgi:hypothetical protein